MYKNVIIMIMTKYIQRVDGLPKQYKLITIVIRTPELTVDDKCLSVKIIY